MNLLRTTILTAGTLAFAALLPVAPAAAQDRAVVTDELSAQLQPPPKQGGRGAGPQRGGGRGGLAPQRNAGPRQGGGGRNFVAPQRGPGARNVGPRSGPGPRNVGPRRGPGPRLVAPRPGPGPRFVAPRPGPRAVGPRPGPGPRIGTRPAGPPRAVTFSGPRVVNAGRLRGVPARGAGRAFVRGQNFSAWRSGYRVRRGGGWRTFVGIGALGAIAVGAATYYPYAYLSAPEPLCDGLTEDGCQLMWQDVNTIDGGVEPQCVAYCPWQ